MKVDIKSAFTTPPPKQDFVLPNLAMGTVGILTSPGGAGKSFFALEAACGIAYPPANKKLLDLEIEKAGKVVYLSLEDPMDEVKRRLFSIGEAINDISLVDKIAKNLHIEVAGKSSNGEMEKPLNIFKYAQDMVSFCAICDGARLVVIDTLSRTHELDENSNSDMAGLIGRFEQLSRDISSNPAILILHHQSKFAATNGSGDQQSASRGASALIDNPRFGAFMRGMCDDEYKELKNKIKDLNRKNYVRYGVSKSNYGRLSEDKWLTRNKNGVLTPALDIEKAFNRQPENPNQAKLPLDTESNVADINTAKQQAKKVEVVFKGEVNDIESY